MKIKFNAIKRFDNISDLQEIISKVNTEVATGEVADYSDNEHNLYDMNDTELWVKLNSHKFETVNGWRQKGDTVWTVNKNAEIITDVMFDVAWSRSAQFGNNAGYTNCDWGIITVIAEESVGGFVQIECEAHTSRNALRKHVLNGVLRLCGFTEEDWADIQIVGDIETDAPHDMSWWELRYEYVTRKLVEGSTYPFREWLDGNMEALVDGSAEYKLDAILDGFAKIHPEYTSSLKQAVKTLLDDKRAIARMCERANMEFSKNMDDIYKNLMSKQ